jgi:hypothetical protein
VREAAPLTAAQRWHAEHVHQGDDWEALAALERQLAAATAAVAPPRPAGAALLGGDDAEEALAAQRRTGAGGSGGSLARTDGHASAW